LGIIIGGIVGGLGVISIGACVYCYVSKRKKEGDEEEQQGHEQVIEITLNPLVPASETIIQYSALKFEQKIGAGYKYLTTLPFLSSTK
jgi:hypothetical protein